jgi:hypothetical protein
VKAINQFPVQTLSGRDVTSPDRVYVPRKGSQVIRRYATSPEVINGSIVRAQSWTQLIAAAYKSLSAQDLSAWCQFERLYSGALPGKGANYTVWTLYKAVNWYRLMAEEPITNLPPAMHKFRSIDSVQVIPNELDDASSSLVLNYSALDSAGYKAVVWYCEPHAGYLHSYRKSEKHLVAYMAPESMFALSDTSGSDTYYLPYCIYAISPGEYLYVTVRLLAPDFFPCLERRYAVQAEGSGMLISTGTQYHTILASTLWGAPYTDLKGWTMQNGGISIRAEGEGSWLVVRIPYNPGSIITGLDVFFRGNKSGGDSLDLYLDYQEMSGTYDSWDNVDTDNIEPGDNPDEPSLISWSHTAVELQSGRAYAYRIQADVDTGPVEVYAVRIKTAKRIY